MSCPGAQNWETASPGSACVNKLHFATPEHRLSHLSLNIWFPDWETTLRSRLLPLVKATLGSWWGPAVERKCAPGDFPGDFGSSALRALQAWPAAQLLTRAVGELTGPESERRHTSKCPADQSLRPGPLLWWKERLITSPGERPHAGFPVLGGECDNFWKFVRVRE